ncbi:glutamate--cysteine ligase [Cryptosporangium japonicum]|uniref:Putative glutamate--cysteine ligase 2 n=1 Tax=Cryptosporangium japonicum TaxID=80872 RepID=A0ABP3EZ85_9ACTN
MSAALTVGVEEEYLLVDPVTGENTSVVDQVTAKLPEHLASRSRMEFRPCMAEMVTEPRVELSDVRDQLRENRSAVAAAAATAGVLALPVGATPIAEADRRPTDDPRFTAIAGHYGAVAHDPAVCGTHVHVGVPSRAAAIDVCRRIRAWLPVLQALTVNSPVHAGADTGYASWRAVQLDRWPSLGPIPHFGSADEYDSAVDSLVASGVMLDRSMVLWHVRPSAKYPTVEVRVADTQVSVEDAVVLAALVRGLVATAVDDEPAVADHLLAAAHWNAARSGLNGTLLDPRSGRARSAWSLVDELAARCGDVDVVHSGLERLHRQGTGADRQRELITRTGSIPAMLRELALST